MNLAIVKKTIVGSLALGLFGLATSAQALMLSISPASQVRMPGDLVSVDILASDLGVAVIGDFDFDIGYDSAALSFSSYSLGAGLGAPGALGDCIDPFSDSVDCSQGDFGGAVNLAQFSYLSSAALDALQGDPLVLATLNFVVDVLAPGDFTTITFDTVWALGNGLGFTPVPYDGTSNGIIRNVPLPATAFLMLAGLAAMRSQRRR
ncbi:hypothetical protein EYC98_05525 [Halieaceae bacterium IMCC14734]|uniref:PEP-CTERM sorting domain-containing protein n=1 Tax=Candidatus Litorirhabdus singularis TaxID=2518993 RepID=A0ABT3TE95_9GAMM|nr:hypothetical protein [Candidatus Litorirhabdus singularis]MCX2980329.1 hypothetical protein [Candidatus Litorirhabdus singularis]